MMKIPEKKQDLKIEVTLPLGMCFGAAIGIIFEPIGLVFGVAGGLLLGVIIPLLFGSGSSNQDENSEKSDT